MLRVTVNGQPRQCAAGQTVLSALRGTADDVPALCDDPRLTPIGGCRLCIVEIAGHDRPVAACTTALADGMAISTHTPDVEHLRRTQLRLLAAHYPSPSGRRSRLSEFERLIRAYGLEDELGQSVRPDAVDDSHPCIHVDMSRCIHCFRCVRICEEVAGRFVWRAWNRGDRTEIRPAQGTNLRDSDCVSCGACVNTCPSGALVDKATLAGGLPIAEVRTVCGYCGTGCEIHAGVRDGRIASVRPVLDAPVNKGHLCVKGRYGLEFVHAPDRITQPMIREGADWKPVTWDRAIALVAEKLQSAIDRFGPDAVGVLGSARATNEENYVAQKFARIVIGTNNVDCCARVCHAPTAAGMKLMLGTGAATNSFDDIEQARTLLVCGANPRENHPIVGDRIVQAARRGAKLIVIDPRKIELTRHACLHLQPRPGTNIPLLNAIAHAIVAEGLFDRAAMDHLENWDSFRRFLADYSPERVAEVCGVAPELIRRAATLYATQKPAMCFHGLGVTEHVQGTEGVMCLVNLALITGNIGRLGSGVNPLRGQNNVQGAAHMGCDPGILTGSVSLKEHGDRFAAIWRHPLPGRPGLDLMKMMDAAEAGRFKALWAIGYDVGLTNPNAASTLAALRSLELLVVQDLFLTETAKLAGNVFLPACSSFEKDGTFMNSERRIQRVRKAIDPCGDSRTDWEIVCQVARAMGHAESFAFQSAEEIWDEIRSVWPVGAGISYERLDRGGLQWPCPAADHPGTTILHAELFAGNHPVKLRAIEFSPTSEQVSEEYPFVLISGRALYQFNAGTMTGRSSTAQFQPVDVVQIAPEDARRLGVVDGQTVRLCSRYGEVSIQAQITATVKAGELFTTFQSPEVFLNRLTGRNRDRFVHTPEYKVTAVRLEVGTPSAAATD
jgi:formate dehydrogenase major subunit